MLRRDPMSLLVCLSPRTAPLSLLDRSAPTVDLAAPALMPLLLVRLLKERLLKRPLMAPWAGILSLRVFAWCGSFSTEPGLSAESALTWLTPGEA